MNIERCLELDLIRDFPEISVDRIKEVIEYFVENSYLLIPMVEEYYKKCTRCGQCCKYCTWLNNNGKCSIHDRSPLVCWQWPYWEWDGAEGVYGIYWCNYSYKIYYDRIVKALVENEVLG
jgi:hypothetical protein